MNTIGFILTEIAGMTFDEAWWGREMREWGGLRVPFLGRPALVASKRASGGHRDFADLEAIGEPTRTPKSDEEDTK